MWIYLTLLSSLFLGSYDLLRKGSLKNNAVIPVLIAGSATSAVFFLGLVALSRLGVLGNGQLLFIPEVGPHEHKLFFIKSCIVGSSWFLSYYALKHLPITIVIPIRSTGPFWTLIGAFVLFNERFSTYQWIGIVTVLTFFYLFSLAGQREGINFLRNKWIFVIIGATILGSISALYDKYLMAHYDRMAVQAWFSIYMVPVFLPFLLFMWYPTRKRTTPFEWRWTIPLIGVTLTIADYFYFYALSEPGSLVAIVSVLRRSSVVMSFALGALIFKEVNLKHKLIALIGILVGIVFIILGS